MNSIRIKRGLSKDLPANLPLGELAFCTDTQELWVGTGSSTPLKKVKDSELEKNLEQTNAQLSNIKDNIIVITNNLTVDEINEKLSFGGTFLFKNGDYLLNKGEKILPTSNSRLIFEPNAWLIYNDFSSTHYYMLEIYNCENVAIENVNIRGCRDYHIGSDGEWGHGIHIVASKNVNILKPYIEKTWGDGIYIGYKWDSTGSAFTTQNIHIQDAHIYKCSRNGISVCSGDNIFIDGCYIEGVDRVFPKCGIDIEPENYYEDIIHLSNLRITNLTTKDNHSGIGFGLYRGYSGCKISIDNHTNYNQTPISWWNGGELPCDVSITNSKYYDTRVHAISINNKGVQSNLTFTNLSIIGRTRQTDYDPLYNSAILITGSTTEKELGNITFNNVFISTKSGYGFKYPVSILNSEGNSSDITIKNVSLSDFRILGSTEKIYNLTKADISTLKLNNIDASIVSNYYLRGMSKESYVNEITYTKLGDYTYIDFNIDSIDGLYKYRLLDPNGKTLTIRLSEDLTKQPSDAVLWATAPKEFNIYKKGNVVYFL